MKVNDENSRILIQDPDLDPNPDQDPLVRGMDPQIGIRIHIKMSWIQNFGFKRLLDENTLFSPVFSILGLLFLIWIF